MFGCKIREGGSFIFFCWKKGEQHQRGKKVKGYSRWNTCIENKNINCHTSKQLRNTLYLNTIKRFILNVIFVLFRNVT